MSLNLKVYYRIIEQTKLCTLVCFKAFLFLFRFIFVVCCKLSQNGRILLILRLNIRYIQRKNIFIRNTFLRIDNIHNLGLQYRKLQHLIANRVALFFQTLQILFLLLFQNVSQAVQERNTQIIIAVYSRNKSAMNFLSLCIIIIQIALLLSVVRRFIQNLHQVSQCGNQFHSCIIYIRIGRAEIRLRLHGIQKIIICRRKTVRDIISVLHRMKIG